MNERSFARFKDDGDCNSPEGGGPGYYLVAAGQEGYAGRLLTASTRSITDVLQPLPICRIEVIAGVVASVRWISGASNVQCRIYHQAAFVCAGVHGRWRGPDRQGHDGMTAGRAAAGEGN